MTETRDEIAIAAITSAQLLREPLAELENTASGLQVVVESLLGNTPRPATDLPLDKARTELLKLNSELNSLRADHEGLLALKFAEPSEHEGLEEVAIARTKVGDIYFFIEQLADQVKMCAAQLPKDSPILDRVDDTLEELNGGLKQCRAVMRALPELGMSFSDFKPMSKTARRKLGKAGRPSAPLEAQISRAQAAVDDMLKYIIAVSGGQIKTLEQALKGVTPSRRGRPATSPMGRLEREILREVQDLERLSAEENDSREHLQKLERRRKKIARLRQEVQELESELVGEDKVMRTLEKLRFEHDQLRTAEYAATGDEQLKILMLILENERQQLIAAEELRAYKPDIRVSVPHKVNPGHTRSQIERLRMTGKLKEADLQRLADYEKQIEQFGS
ncbi:hypothetical protein HNP46_000177 [Pseudomonas nitritireducens]|uniref:Uncharacterized protein n=1 Tax=Pseudomonas nitroreducens TaxID=46680 RepID=A0A7W7NYE5_PSENT|nr:hypothetical protein [Pseudomonas nitritireducens]MBB4861366.1 hypothetical protein [Pseudomonas nitritireducens]